MQLEDKITRIGSVDCRRDLSARSNAYFAISPAIDRAIVMEKHTIEALKTIAMETGMNTRLCLHCDVNDHLQEMVIVQHREKFFPPKKHLMRDKTFWVLEGALFVATFNENGTISNVTKLSSDGNLAARVTHGTYHVDIPQNDFSVHLEVTHAQNTNAEDLSFPSWGPTDEDGRQELIKAVYDKADNIA